jgi:Skp family chaperone for outer membrane proteins
LKQDKQMKNKILGLGWLVAGAMGVMMIASGFQATGVKAGVVDMQRILSESAAGKKVRDDMSVQVDLRQGLLQFVNTNKVVSAEQADKLKTLTLKPGATQADKDEVERIKTAIRNATKKFNDLLVKASLTDSEKIEYNTMNEQRRNADTMLGQWNQEFSGDLNTLQDEMLAGVLKKAREAVQAVGKKDAYTMIFPTTVAVYASNDITDAAIKAVDEAK